MAWCSVADSGSDCSLGRRLPWTWLRLAARGRRKNARSKASSSNAGSKKKKSKRRVSILRKPVFRSQPEVAANDSGGGIFKGDGMKSKGRSPDIKPWPSHPGTFFFFSPTGRRTPRLARAAYRRPIGHLSEDRSLKPPKTPIVGRWREKKAQADLVLQVLNI